MLKYIIRDSTEPCPLTKLVQNSCILQPRLAALRNGEFCLGAVCVALVGEPLAGKDTADEVPDRTVAAALGCVRGLVGARTRERGFREIGVETLDGSDHWITEGEPLRCLRNRQDQGQRKCGENGARQHDPQPSGT